MPTKGYMFKWVQETAWFATLAASVFLFTTLSDLATISDWKTWAVSLGAGAVRVVSAVVLNQLGKLAGAVP